MQKTEGNFLNGFFVKKEIFNFSAKITIFGTNFRLKYFSSFAAVKLAKKSEGTNFTAVKNEKYFSKDEFQTYQALWAWS